MGQRAHSQSVFLTLISSTFSYGQVQGRTTTPTVLSLQPVSRAVCLKPFVALPLQKNDNREAAWVAAVQKGRLTHRAARRGTNHNKI